MFNDGLIYSVNNLFAQYQKDKPTPFQILDTDGNVLLEMTSLYDLSYEQKQTVAYEPQENGVFYSNSKQATPFKLQITATSIPIYDGTVDFDELQTQVEDVQIALEELIYSDTIVEVRAPDYYYENMTLFGQTYIKTAEIPVLFAELSFQEVRVANVQFQELPENSVNDPINASNATQGQVQTTTPDSDSAALAAAISEQ